MIIDIHPTEKISSTTLGKFIINHPELALGIEKVNIVDLGADWVISDESDRIKHAVEFKFDNDLINSLNSNRLARELAEMRIKFNETVICHLAVSGQFDNQTLSRAVHLAQKYRFWFWYSGIHEGLIEKMFDIFRDPYFPIVDLSVVFINREKNVPLWKKQLMQIKRVSNEIADEVELSLTPETYQGLCEKLKDPDYQETFYLCFRSERNGKIFYRKKDFQYVLSEMGIKCLLQ